MFPYHLFFFPFLICICFTPIPVDYYSTYSFNSKFHVLYQKVFSLQLIRPLQKVYKHTIGFCVRHTQLPTPSKSSPLLITYLATVLVNSNNTPSPHFQITGWQAPFNHFYRVILQIFICLCNKTKCKDYIMKFYFTAKFTNFYQSHQP